MFLGLVISGTISAVGAELSIERDHQTLGPAILGPAEDSAKTPPGFFEVEAFTIDWGGGRSAADGLVVVGTVGQPEAAISTGAPFESWADSGLPREALRSSSQMDSRPAIPNYGLPSRRHRLAGCMGSPKRHDPLPTQPSLANEMSCCFLASRERCLSHDFVSR